MIVVERLQKVLCKHLGICVPQEEIAVESVQLYVEEMDEKLLSPEMLKGLTEPIQRKWRATEMNMVSSTFSFDLKSAKKNF